MPRSRGDVAQLGERAHRRQVRGHRDEDPVRPLEHRAVERAVGRVGVDDDVVHAAPGDGDRAWPRAAARGVGLPWGWT